MRRLVRVDALSVAAFWVGLSTVLVVAGWGLSLGAALTPAGYLMVLVPAAALAGLVVAGRLRLAWRPRWRRYRRVLPLIFVVAWTLAVLGGLLHAPNNIDTMAYRLPRLLHWLAEHRWHWIDTVDPRMNYSACGQEWLMAPLVSLTGSDQWTWAWNALAEALLPGLLFVVLRGLRVAGAVAWRWMWLLPLAPVYLLQAGSVANDLLGAAWFLAALALAFSARRRRSPADLAWSAVAMALATGVKASNLPLALPWVLLVGPELWKSGPMRRACLVAFLPALLVSAVPTLALNRWRTGDWAGDPADLTMVKAGHPWSGLIGNSAQAVLQNLQPPVFPVAEAVENRLAASVEPRIRHWLGRDFPRFSVHLTELAQEEWAGVGGFLCVLLVGGACWPRAGRDDLAPGRGGTGLVMANGIAGLAFFVTMGSEMTARLLAPYYPLAVAAVLRGGRQRSWVRSRWFALLAGLAIVGSLTPLVISPARPLVSIPGLLRLSAPVERIAPGIIARATLLYDVYGHRADFLHDLCARIPPGTRVVGFMATADDSEVSCWRPIGSRTVATVRPADTAAALRRRGIQWIVIRADILWPMAAERDAWLASRQAAVAATATVWSKAHRPRPEEWVLVRLADAADPG